MDFNMQYRKDKSGNNLSPLGLGCMRLPRDKAEAERMVLAAIEGGINFFDTGYIYLDSEKTLGEILAKHNKRDAVYISAKLPIFMCKTTTDFDKFFDEQLRRLKTEYIDYYFMHCITGYAEWEALVKLGIEQWLEDKKNKGQIRQIGFSFHGTCDEFLKILTAYPWELCMIQYNYFDENYQAGKKGLLAAAEKDIAVIVMEPLLGGTLATGLPQQAKKLFEKSNPGLTPADWGLWWLWNQDEVTVVLSGMTSSEIVDKNLHSIQNFRQLTDQELAVYTDVVAEFKKTYKINCTGCNYCLPCPKGINIPACFSAYNASYTQGYMQGLTLHAVSTGAVVTKAVKSPRLCNQCGKCEKICPQKLPIRKDLKKVAGRFELLPMRMILALRRILTLRDRV